MLTTYLLIIIIILIIYYYFFIIIITFIVESGYFLALFTACSCYSIWVYCLSIKCSKNMHNYSTYMGHSAIFLLNTRQKPDHTEQGG